MLPTEDVNVFQSQRREFAYWCLHCSAIGAMRLSLSATSIAQISSCDCGRGMKSHTIGFFYLSRRPLRGCPVKGLNTGLASANRPHSNDYTHPAFFYNKVESPYDLLHRNWWSLNLGRRLGKSWNPSLPVLSGRWAKMTST